MPEARADELLDAWMGEAAARGIAPGDALYWSQAETWLEAQLRRT